MDDLLKDPRPDIIQDSGLWEKLFRKCVQMDNETGHMLLRRFWTMRSVGTMLRPTADGTLKFTPIIGNGSDWEDEAFFEELKRKYLAPYAKEITELLRRVMKE